LGLSTEILAQGSAEEKFKTAITENLSKDPLAKSQWEMLLSLGWDIKLDRRIKDPAHIRDIGLLPLNASYKKLMESHYYPSKTTITVNPHFSLKKIARELSNKILTQATLLPVTAQAHRLVLADSAKVTAEVWIDREGHF